MFGALERLQQLQCPAQLSVHMHALGKGGFLGAFGLKKLTMTHHLLEDRIIALRNYLIA